MPWDQVSSSTVCTERDLRLIGECRRVILKGDCCLVLNVNGSGVESVTQSGSVDIHL